MLGKKIIPGNNVQVPILETLDDGLRTMYSEVPTPENQRLQARHAREHGLNVSCGASRLPATQQINRVYKSHTESCCCSGAIGGAGTAI